MKAAGVVVWRREKRRKWRGRECGFKCVWLQLFQSSLLCKIWQSKGGVPAGDFYWAN